MVNHWKRTRNTKFLEKDVKKLLNSLIRSFKNKFEGRLFGQLQRNQKKYEYDFSYETEQIPYTIEGNYIPDFPIKKKSGKKMYIEGKGYFRPESKRKMVAVKKQHPELDIRIVFYSARKRDIKWAEKNGFPYAIGRIPLEWLEN
jgi:Autographiviridae endonuclease I